MILDEVLKQVDGFLRNYNDDVVDRFHYVYSVIGLSIYLVFLTSKQYLGDMIQCNFNGGLSSDSAKYIQTMCWMNGTYQFVRDDNYKKMDFTMVRKLDYYQWIIFIIIFKIFLFRLPGFIWNVIIYLNGFDMVYVSKIIMAKLYLDEYTENTNYTKTQKSIEAISDHLRMTFLKQKFSLSAKFRASSNKSSKEDEYNVASEKKEDSSLFQQSKAATAHFRRIFPNLKTKVTFPLYAPYLFIKVVYIGIIIFNFFFLSLVFEFNYWRYGVYMVQSYFSNSMNTKFHATNDYFPKNSMCDVYLINKNVYTYHSVVCALPINLFNESFYLIYWFWLIFLLAATLASIVHWLLLSLHTYRRRLITQALQLDPNQNISRSYTAAWYLGAETSNQQADAFLREKTGLSLNENLELFVRDVCSADVVFTLNMLALNSNRLALRDLVNNLWQHYLNLEDVEPKDLKQRPVLPIKRSLGFERLIEDSGPRKTPLSPAFYDENLEAVSYTTDSMVSTRISAEISILKDHITNKETLTKHNYSFSFHL